MAKAPNLFGPADFTGGNAAPIDDLFATPKTATPSTGGLSASTSVSQRIINRAMTPKQPTQKQLKAQAEADRQRQVESVRQQLLQMQQSPEWAGASLDRRRDLYTKWKEQKWDPMLRSIQDSDLQEALSILPAETLNADIKNLEKSIDDSSRLSDTWQGVKANALQTAQGVGDYAPAAIDQARIENLRNMLAMDGKPLVLGGVPQMNSDGTPYIQKFTPEERKQLEDQIAELTGSRNEQLKQAAETQKDIYAIRNQRSIGQIDRDRELQEDIGNYGGFGGTMLNALAHPSNALQLATEQLPNAGAAILATTAGGLTAGPTGAVAGARLSGGLLSAQDAMSSAIQQVQQMPAEQLVALDSYKQLIAQGLNPDQARDELALRAGFDAAGLGAVVGTVTGGLGAEAGLGQSLSAILTREAGPEAASSLLRTAARQLPTFARELGVEGLEEGGTQLVTNVAQNRQTGSNVDILNDVGESAAQGIIASAPISGVTVAQETYRAGRNTAAPADTGGDSGVSGAPNADPNTVAQPATGGIDNEGTITVPDATEAATAQQSSTAPEASAESQPADTSAPTSALAQLRPVFQDINSRAGQAFEATEANAFIDQLIAAEDNGAPRNVIENALTNITRVVPPGLGYTSILDGYNQRRAARGEAAVDEMASAIVTNEEVNNGTTEPVTEADSGSAATVADVNSAMETVTAASEPAATTVPEAAQSVSAEPEVAGVSRTEGDSAAENGSATSTAETVGAIDRAITTDSRPDNQPVPDTSAAVSVSERVEPGETRPGPADGRSTDSAAVSEAGRNTRVGDTVTYSAPFRGAQPVTGQVTQINPDGTFNLAVRGENATTTYANLPLSNIRQEPSSDSSIDNADALARMNQAVADGRMTAEQAERLTQNAMREVERTNVRSAAGDYITERLNRLDGILPERPQDSSTITPGGRDMPALRGTAYEALGSKDPALFQAASELTQALVNNDPVAADNAAQILEQAGFNRASPIYQAQPVANHEQEQLGVTSAPGPADAAIIRDAEANTTPSGYNTENLAARADRLAESDSEHAFTGMELSQALEDGDFVKADELAQYLFEQGLRQFRPPQQGTGRAARTIDDVFLNELEPAERLALQREYADMADTLPPEADSFAAFRDTAVQDQLLMNAGEAPNSDIMLRMSKFGRAIIQKLARALAIVLAAITINNMVPVNDAVAATGQGYVQTVQQVQGLSRPASAVNSWVQQSKDNAGRPYIIADKQSGEIHIVGADGQVKATAPALYGRKMGDGMTIGETPAGIFTIHQEAAPASYGGDLQQFATAPDGDVYAIHRVLTNNKQDRPGRLASPTAEDNRISLGCINIPADLYNKYLSGKFDGKLYVLPDQRSLGDVFKGIDEQRAQQNLTPSEQMPEKFDSPDATQYQSSTSTIAPGDFHDTGSNVMDTGAAVTEEAQNGDMSTATAFTAAQGNDPADSGIVYAVALPFLAFGRNQRRAQKGKKNQSPDQTLDPNATPRSVSDKDYHSVDAVLGKQQSAVNDQPAHNASRLGDWTGKLAQKLSDSQHAFISWMDDTGLVPTNGEHDAHAAIYALKSQNNRMRQRNEALTQQYMVPIFNHIVSVAQRLGRSPDQVGLEMGSWQTFRHIPEANRALRQNLENDLNNIILTGTEAEVQAAQTKLATFDQVQNGQADIGELRKVGVGGLAGGLTDAQARAGIQKVEALGYRPEDLAEFRRLTRATVDGLVQERVRNGTLLQEEVDQWNAHGFTDYVPLYVNHERQDAGNDVYLGTSNFNPAGDYTRNGSVTRASHAMITLQQMLYRTAAGIESMPFKEQLHAMYLNDRPAGLQRVNLADARMNPRSDVFNQEIYDKRGFTYTVRGVDENQQPTITRYKYYFDDDAISQGIFDNHAEPDWKVVKLLSGATAGFGRLLTKYNPLFPIKTWWRDAGERRRTLASRKITDSQGNVIPLRKLYTGMMASLYNPVHVANLGAYLMTGGRADTPTVRAYQELQRLGGVSTYQHALAKSVTDMRSTLKSMTGLRKHAKSLDRFFTHWNEMWAAAPAVAGYMALRNMDVPADQAAFRTLDVMNASNKGEWHGTLSVFYPFIAPTFEGGRNMLRNLRSRRGQAIFAANVVSSIALYSMLFSLASSMAGDDDDQGNLLDNMSMDDLSMNIPLIIGKNDIIKIPVAFGMSRASWMIGAGLHRLSRGVDTPGKVMGSTTLAILRELQPIELETKVMSDNIMAGLTLSAAPAILSPMLEVAMNTNHFGGMIHSKAAREGFASDAAMSNTPQVWTDIAKALRQYTGLDTYPENIRHLSQAWLVGPLRGVSTALEKSSLYTTGGKLTSRQEIGPVWDAVGVAQFWDNGSRGVSRTYWKYQEQADDILRKYGQLRTKEGTKPGDAATAAYRRVLVAGGSPQEALLVQYAIEADKAREKANRELKASVKDYKQKDLSLELLSPKYEQHVEKEERMMREFIRRARGLK